MVNHTNSIENLSDVEVDLYNNIIRKPTLVAKLNEWDFRHTDKYVF